MGFCALFHCAELAFLCYVPLCIICLRAVGHSAGSGSALCATAQNLVKRYGPQLRISFKSYPVCIHWHCIHMRIVVYPVIMYPCAHGDMQTCAKCCIQLFTNWRLFSAMAVHDIYSELTPPKGPVIALRLRVCLTRLRWNIVYLDGGSRIKR
jgi:hypothetical protein